MDEDPEGEGRLTVYRNDVGKLPAGGATALGTVAFEKIILIDDAVSGRISLDAADGIRASHAGIIRGGSKEVNARREPRECRNGKASSSAFPVEKDHANLIWDKRRKEKTLPHRGVSQVPPNSRPGPRDTRKIGLRWLDSTFAAFCRAA